MNMRITTFGALVASTLVALLITLGSATASAQDGDDFTDELSQEAQEHYNRGIEAYKAGAYEDTIDELLAAYSLTPDPMLLYNIALAYWKSGDTEAARRSALRARAEGLPGKVAVRNEARLSAFETILRVDELTGGRTTEPQAQKKPPESTDEVAEEHQPQQVEPADSGGMGALGWTGVAMVTAGTLALGGAWLINGQLADDAEPLRTAAREGDGEGVRQFRDSELDDLQSKQTLGQVLLIGGAIAATMGTTFLVVDLLGGESASGDADAARASASSVEFGGAWSSSGPSLELRGTF